MNIQMMDGLTGLDQLLRYMIGAQVVCGKFLYTVLRQKRVLFGVPMGIVSTPF